ncbi:Hypothetical protein CINCED_3A013631 [Cinara cedri]|nr:Hypothetical protein CINCED_3A013631 [Cinara cedri]
MGFYVQCESLAASMRTKRKNVKKPAAKYLVNKRSVGRPRKPTIIKLQKETSDNIPIHKSVITKTPNGLQVQNNTNLLNSNSSISEGQGRSSSSLENIVYHAPIAKTTSELLRNKLLSTDRNRFNQMANNCITQNNYYHQRSSSTPLNLKIAHKASSTKWKNNGGKLNTPVDEIKSSVLVNNNIPNIQAFPDIPQLADVDIHASFELENFNNCINDQTDTDSLYIDDSDTLSNRSSEDTEQQEQQDFDQRWAMANGGLSAPLVNYDTFNTLDGGSLLGPQDTVLVQNDVIQNYIETNDVQSMQLPESSCEVSRTLQYYESALLTNPWSFSQHLQNLNGSMINEQIVQDGQFNAAGTNHTIAEIANMLPCPIAGCLWYSHSATLYVHLFSCHQEFIYYGNLITHVFRCQDIQNFCFFTHLQYIHNIIFIITVSFDCYSHTFVATIQHVSSHGDNTSVSSTTAILTTGSLYNSVDQHSWTGQVQPYSTPLDILHTDGRCLFIDPANSPEHVLINVNLSAPLIYSNDSMFACL